MWCPSDGVWCVSDGVCCVNDGVCCVSDGVWCVSDRVWCVSDGVWCVSDGVWCVSDGVWCVSDCLLCVVLVTCDLCVLVEIALLTTTVLYSFYHAGVLDWEKLCRDSSKVGWHPCCMHRQLLTQSVACFKQSVMSNS